MVFKISVLLFLCLLVFTDCFLSYSIPVRDSLYQRTAEFGLSLEEITIQGRKHMPEDEILSAINTSTGSPILAIDIEAIRKRFEDNKWVKAAIVERRLPNSLYIALMERDPIAIWQFEQKLYLIDADGNSISSKNIANYSQLLHVVGQDANIAAQKLISEIKADQEFYKKITSAVRHGKRRWDLYLDGGIIVKMPEENFDQAYSHLLKLYKENRLFNNNYKMLDLRNRERYHYEENAVNNDKQSSSNTSSSTKTSK